jgi:cytidine deaminase
MNKFKLNKYNRKVFEIPQLTCIDLLEKATASLNNCYPVANEGYAVTVLTDKGNVYTGSSYKSDTETLTMHSEAIALAHAAQHGETKIIAITGPNCHICKQLIWENSLKSGIEIQIIIKEDKRIKLVPISDLMPYPWPDLNGNK